MNLQHCTFMILANQKSEDITVKPISLGDERSLLYDRWVKTNEDEDWRN
jgi:tricorn protease